MIERNQNSAKSYRELNECALFCSQDFINHSVFFSLGKNGKFTSSNKYLKSIENHKCSNCVLIKYRTFQISGDTTFLAFIRVAITLNSNKFFRDKKMLVYVCL